MHSTVGWPRSVSDAQVATILEWRLNHRTWSYWTQRLGVSRTTLQNAIAQWTSALAWDLNRKPRFGRERQLTGAQLEPVVLWYREWKSGPELARELGISVSTFNHVVRMKGRYKHPSPELEAANKKARRQRMKEVESMVWRPIMNTKVDYRQLRALNTARFKAWTEVEGV